jgi:hypothetical protein
MLTTPRPARGPAYTTTPAAAARTVAPGIAARSTPRWPGSHGRGGGAKPRTTTGGPSRGHTHPARTGGAAEDEDGVGPPRDNTRPLNHAGPVKRAGGSPNEAGPPFEGAGSLRDHAGAPPEDALLNPAQRSRDHARPPREAAAPSPDVAVSSERTVGTSDAAAMAMGAKIATSSAMADNTAMAPAGPGRGRMPATVSDRNRSCPERLRRLWTTLAPVDNRGYRLTIWYGDVRSASDRAAGTTSRDMPVAVLAPGPVLP